MDFPYVFLMERRDKMKAFILAGTHSGVGKTTLSLGLMRSFLNKGEIVRPFKVGPDYIDTGYHSLAAKKKSINIDSFLLNENNINELFNENMKECTLGIIEGVMGLYDGKGIEKSFASTAHMANLLNLPVILVVDGKGVALSIAAMVHGFKTFKDAPYIKGVIINNVNSRVHYNLLKEAIELHTGVECFGYVPKMDNIELKSRHLGLYTVFEDNKFEDKIENFSNELDNTIDVNRIKESLDEINILKFNKLKTNIIIKKRVAYAFDAAFHFYYEDNFKQLKDRGIELIPFSPLKDKKLPKDIDGIYIGGGYPEIYKEELSKNKSIRDEILRYLENDLPCYAECGGMMYLTRGFKDNNKFYPWVGFLDGESYMTNKLQSFGYIEVETPFGNSFKAHNFHYSNCDNDNKGVYTLIKRNKKWREGFLKKKTLAGYPHVHFRGAEEFLEFLIKHL